MVVCLRSSILKYRPMAESLKPIVEICAAGAEALKGAAPAAERASVPGAGAERGTARTILAA